jgi:hypothetical protein
MGALYQLLMVCEHGALVVWELKKQQPVQVLFLLTLQSSVLIENLIVAQPIKTSPAFYANSKIHYLIDMPRHWIQLWAT